jgi:hypothetical protein
MPSYKVHIIGGVATFGALYTLSTYLPFLHPTSIPNFVALLGISMLGAIFPDIDTKSRMQRIYWLSLILFIPLALLTAHKRLFWELVAISITLLFITHRRLTHRAWFLVAISALFSGILYFQHRFENQLIISGCIYFVSGGLSHLLLDFGISKFWPKK